MEKTSVSFFPSEILLSVDKQLISQRKMLHSRNPKEIVEYVLLNYKNKKKFDKNRCKKVKKEVIYNINSIIE